MIALGITIRQPPAIPPGFVHTLVFFLAGVADGKARRPPLVVGEDAVADPVSARNLDVQAMVDSAVGEVEEVQFSFPLPPQSDAL